jgi:hypothetical protein
MTTKTTTTTTTTTSAKPTGTCPLNLPSNYEFPHLIVPIDSSSPSTAVGTQLFGTVTSTVSSLFNFDIPSSDSGKTCTLYFSLPTQAQLVTSSFTLSGPGSLSFASLKTTASGSTTFNNAPAIASQLGTVTAIPGNAYKVTSFSCPAGQAMGFEVSSVGGTSFKWFQDFNPCAIGLFIIPS